MLCERYEQSEDQAQVQEEWIKPRTFTTIVKDCFSKEQWSDHSKKGWIKSRTYRTMWKIVSQKKNYDHIIQRRGG